jgi:hypothetical protein
MLPKNSVGNYAASSLKLLIHDHDYFAFDVPTAGTYNLKTGYSGPSAAPVAQLLAANGATLKTFGTSGLNVNLGKGRYYLHAYDPSRSLVGTYALSATRTGTASVTRSLPPSTSTFSTTRSAFFTRDDSIFA